MKSILIFYKGYDDDGGDDDGGDDDDQDDEHVYRHLYCEHHIGYLFLCSSLFQTTVMLVDSLHARRPLLQGSVCRGEAGVLLDTEGLLGRTGGAGMNS